MAQKFIIVSRVFLPCLFFTLSLTTVASENIVRLKFFKGSKVEMIFDDPPVGMSMITSIHNIICSTKKVNGGLTTDQINKSNIEKESLDLFKNYKAEYITDKNRKVFLEYNDKGFWSFLIRYY